MCPGGGAGRAPPEQGTPPERPAPGGPADGRRDIDDDLHKGDHVRWNSHGGTAEGTVRRRITSDTEATGRTVRAREDDPQYEVRSETGGGTAVHRPAALRKTHD